MAFMTFGHRFMRPRSCSVCALSRSGSPIRCGLIGALVGAASLAPFTAHGAGVGGRQPADEPKSGTLLVFEHVGLGNFLVDPKDRALSDALAMLPARLRELPRQVPDMEPQIAEMITLVLATVARPARLAVNYNAENPAGGAFGYGVVVSFAARDERDADAMHDSLGAIAAMAPQAPKPKPSQRWEGMTDVQLPFGLLSYGPRRSEAGWRYEVIFGSIDDPESGLASLPAPMDGVTTVARARLDLSVLTPAVNMVQMMAGGENPEFAGMLAEAKGAGLLGPDAMKVSFQSGYTATEAVSLTTIEGAAGLAEGGALPVGELTEADLNAVPADASVASVSKRDLSTLGHLLDHAAADNPQVEYALAEFRDRTGVDLREDILQTLGGTVGCYLSESTGGGSLASAVAFISFKDRARFLEAHDRLVRFANDAADRIPIGPGYVRLVPWKDGDIDLVSLRFPGLPVPLELTYAPTADWLVFGLTPQGALAAARQVGAGGRAGPGLSANPVFGAAIPKGRTFASISFVDPAQTMRTGYPIVTLLGSAVANAVRSSIDPEREPGLLVPTYGELKAGARPHVSVSYWRGDDYLTETRSDRSMLVNMASKGGVIAAVLPAVAIPAVFGAFQAREQAGMDDAAAPVAPWPTLAAAARAVLARDSEVALFARAAGVDISRLDSR